MAFDWTEYLHLAKFLMTIDAAPTSGCMAGNPDNLAYRDVDEEARCRVAVSRAYYAAFGRVRSFLDQHPPEDWPNVRRIHRAVAERMLRFGSDDPDIREPCAAIFNQLEDLKDERQRADYEAEIVYTAEQAHNAIDMAEELLVELDKVIAHVDG